MINFKLSNQRNVLSSVKVCEEMWEDFVDTQFDGQESLQM